MSLPTQAVGEEGRPVLHLDGPKLTAAFQTVIDKCDDHGGVEKFVGGIAFKSSVFQEALKPENIPSLDKDSFLGLAAFMASVRRRLGPWLDEAGPGGMITVRNALLELLDTARDTAHADAAVAHFCAQFPDGKKYRWVRDLAAEVLHNVMPEHYPLMTRWVWDRKANTGVIREIWFGENVDHMTLEIPDGYQTFLVLREELSQFLSNNGVFRDMLFYVDLICAQIYADYICEQGGSYLRTDFASPEDPLQYTRRMLGLDGIDPDTGRTRAKGTGGRPLVLDGSDQLH